MINFSILIPCKPLNEGKSRLSQLLSARARYELCAYLLVQTLKLARLVAHPDRIFLITADEFAATQARVHGAVVIADSAGDLNGALRQGRDHILRRSHACDEGLLVLPIDLPFADKAAIEKTTNGFDVTLVGDIGKNGTNLLVLKGNAARNFPFSFGTNSLARHCHIARRAGYSLASVDDPALAFDLDTPEDYLHANRVGRLKLTELVS